MPSPFREEDITELFKVVGEGCRLMGNHQHVCSEKFIIRCLDAFKPLSEELALKRLKAGMKPGQPEEKKAKP